MKKSSALALQEDYLSEYSKITKSIRITVVPDHIVENSDPKNDVYAFSYSITVENLSDQAVQLLERHWVIMSAGVQIAEVVGPGVVGCQPIVEPGHVFEYTSGAVIHDPIGSMHGSYTFRNEEGAFLEVIIPRFDLLYPIMLH